MNRTTYTTWETTGGYTESSVTTPGFLKLRKLGQRLPINDYLWERYDHVFPQAYTYNGWQREWMYIPYSISVFQEGRMNDARSGPDSYCDTMANVQNQLTNRLLDKTRNSEVNLGVALGEYRETAEFVTKSMIKVARAIRAARKGNFGQAIRSLTGSSRKNTWADVPKAAANTWLGVTYGLKPLLADIYGSIKELERSRGAGGIVQVKRVNSSKPVNISLTASTQTSDHWYYRNASIAGRCSGSITFEVNNPFLYTLDQLGVTNPALVAWELVPYSFVVDWFIPVGDYLTHIRPPQGVDFVSGFISHHYRGSGISRTWVQSPYGSGNPDYPDWNTHGSGIHHYKRRIRLSSFPEYRLIVPNVNLTKNRVISGISLIVQALTGGKRG